MIAIVGLDAARKAERSAEALVARARMIFAERKIADFSAVHVEVLGAEASYGKASRARQVREVVLRLVVEHADPKALGLFAREIGSAGLSFAQGTAGLIGGRPKPSPVIRLYTFFIDKPRLAVTVQVGDAAPFSVNIPGGQPPQAGARTAEASPAPVATDDDHVEVPLLRVAHARSGDKGDSSNIAIFCRKPHYLAHLRAVLTTERIAAHFAGTVSGTVERFDAPGVHAVNFLIGEALGGGGMASRRIDPQGKAYGQRALEMLVPVPRAWLREP